MTMKDKQLMRVQSEMTIGSCTSNPRRLTDKDEYRKPSTLSQGITSTKIGGSSTSVQQEDNRTENVTQSMTPYEKLLYLLHHEKQFIAEINQGRRIGFYKIGRELGSGNFSKVKLGVHVLTKERVAIKIMDKSKMDTKSQKLLAREIHNMQEIRHPNIIRLFEVIGTLSKIYLFMEFAGGGSLYQFVQERGRLEERETVEYYAQVLAAVHHMHSLNVVHRDIKAENILFAHEGYIKLGDLGFSRDVHIDGTQLNTFCGSPPYAAPELYKDKQYNGVSVDIWALGILLYFMVTGATPFIADTVAELKKMIITAAFHMPIYISIPCADLISGILKRDPAERITLKNIMTHPFVGEYEYKEGYGSMPKLKDYLERRQSLVFEENMDMNQLLILMGEYGITDQVLMDSIQTNTSSHHYISGTFNILAWKAATKEEYNEETQLYNTPEEPKDHFVKRVWLKKRPSSQFCVIA